MTRFLLLTSLALSVFTSSAQSVISADTIWLFKSPADDYLTPSYFPNVSIKNNPSATRLINEALQMQELSFLLTQKRLAELQKDQFQKIFGYRLLSLTNRLVAIDIMTYHRYNSMSENGYYSSSYHYFDLSNGKQIHLSSLLTTEGYQKLTTRVLSLLKTEMIKTRDALAKQHEEQFTESQTKDCIGQLSKAFCQYSIQMDYHATSQLFTFTTLDCDFMPLPFPKSTYSVSLGMNEVRNWLSDYGNYLLNNGPQASNESVFHKVWKGSLGDKIPVTIIVRPGCKTNEVTGVEVYDKFGTVIPLSGTFVNQLLTVSELDDKGKPVAIIEATFSSGKLSGRWKKPDGSKQFPFQATE